MWDVFGLNLESIIQNNFPMFRLTLTMLLSGALFFMACNDDDNDAEPEPDPKGSTLIAIDHEVDGDPLELDEIKYENAAGNIYSVFRLRYFVTDFAFHKENGDVIDGDNIHLRNVTKEDSREFKLEENLEAGDYEKITFTFGLDEDKNEHMRYSDNFEFQQMEWPEPMGGGYHYMQLDGNYYKEEGADSSSAFNTHTGRVMEAEDEDTIKHDNHFTVEFEEEFSIEDGDQLEMDLVMDINEWYENPNMYDFSNYDGIMANQEAQELLRENAIQNDLFRIEELSIE